MHFLKKIIIAMFVFVLLCNMFPIVTLATTTFDGLEISITTDKSEYNSKDEIEATLTVKNTNASAVTNITLENKVPEGYKAVDEDGLNKIIDSLATDASDTLVASYKIQNSTNPVVTIILFSLLGLIVVGASILIVLIVIKRKKAKTVIALLLCLAMIGSFTPFTVNASDNQNFLVISHTIMVDGKPFELNATIAYDNVKGPKTNIIINDAGMLYDEESDMYYAITPFHTLQGTLQNASNVKRAICNVTDVNGVTLFQREFEPATTWTIDNFGMIVGVNKIEIVVEYNNGTKNTNIVFVNNICEENMEALTVDKNDDDGDGVLNFIEELYHTDSKSTDTDSDNLSDYHEMAILGTDPLKADTDDDGVTDAMEDTDNDTLTDGDEIGTYKTNPIIMDTDGDTLSDKEELTVYSTNPCEKDTDGDGKEDRWELENNYDPLMVNTDFPIEKIQSPEHISVKSDGYVQITQMTDNYLLNEDTPGYIGEDPFYIDLEEGYDAQISMSYNPEALDEGETPTLYYYNEETQCYEEVPSTTDENGNVNAIVEKKGLYILLNHRYVDDVWDNDIFRPSQNNKDGSIDVVFVIDRSNSMYSNDPNEIRKEVTKNFIAKLRDNVDRAAIVQFTAIAETVSPLTHDKEGLSNAVDYIENSDGGGCSGTDANAGTNGSAGIRQALTELRDSTAAHKYIIFLTDGDDTTVSEDYGDENGTFGLTAEAKRNGIIIHTVGLVGNGSVDVDLLKRVAKGTGGNYYLATVGEEAETESELVEIYQEIESVTIDRQLDSNNDGISDYYTRVICEGKLTTATGFSNLFGHVTYDEVQANDDFDGDGLKNGQELEVVENEKGVYVKVHSYPYIDDSDGDNLIDPYEKQASTSPLKRNAFAESLDIQWLTTDENFESYLYLDLYNENIWTQGSVFIGNAFFGSTLDQTVLYKQVLVDYFNAIDAELLYSAELENYQDLAASYIDASVEAIKQELTQLGENGDFENFMVNLEHFNNLVGDFVDIHEVSKSISILSGRQNIFLELSNLSDNWNKEYFEAQMDGLKHLMTSVPSEIPRGDRETWSVYLEKLGNQFLDYHSKANMHAQNIDLRVAKFSKFAKKLEVVGKIADVIQYGTIAWNSYMDYCNLLASMETIENNIYVLDCILATSSNGYLIDAAAEIKFYLNESYSQQWRDVTMVLGDVTTASMSIAMEALHSYVATLGVPGLIIELGRTVGNLVFNLDDASEGAAKTVALAETATILAENYQDHLDGGYAVNYSELWISYADYSDRMYITLLNLIQVRKQAETIIASWQNSVKQQCEKNISTCDELIEKYNQRYYFYYLN